MSKIIVKALKLYQFTTTIFYVSYEFIYLDFNFFLSYFRLKGVYIIGINIINLEAHCTYFENNSSVYLGFNYR